MRKILIVALLLVGIFSFSQSAFSAWDETQPAAGILASQLDDVTRANFAAIDAILGDELDAGDVLVLDEDDLSSDSDTQVPSQQSVKAYVDGLVLSGYIDEDDMSSDSASYLPTQQSVKAYVDSGAVTMTNKTLTTPIINSGGTVSATGDEIDAVADGVGVTIPRQKLVEIGDWDMDSTGTVSVAHGLDVEKIVGFRAAIRNDSDTVRYIVPYVINDAKTLYFGATDALYVNISRLAGTFFDSASYDSTSYNRGWITIEYID